MGSTRSTGRVLHPITTYSSYQFGKLMRQDTSEFSMDGEPKSYQKVVFSRGHVVSWVAIEAL